ncbi:MAG TPA: hypothetical protein VL856_08225 [Acidimicrobiia bacterium]|nr:hypothetical protein [Acidimicrobiia bacterium]
MIGRDDQRCNTAVLARPGVRGVERAAAAQPITRIARNACEQHQHRQMRLRRLEERGRNPNEGSAMLEPRHHGGDVDSRHESVLRDRGTITALVMTVEKLCRHLAGQRCTDEIADCGQVRVVRVDLQSAEGQQRRHREQRHDASPPRTSSPLPRGCG